MASLTEKVLAYRETGTGFDAVRKQIAEIVYDFPAHRRGFDEDDCGGFLLFFYPKIRHLVDGFQPRGIPFEHYLKRTLRWQIKTYANTRRTARNRRKAEENPGFWADSCLGQDDGSQEVSENLYGPGFFDSADRAPCVADARKRRLVVLALKGCTAMDDAQLQRVARMVGISAAWLTVQRDMLADRRQRKEGRLEVLRRRRNAAYAMLVQLEHERAAAVEPARRDQLSRRIDVYRNRLHTAVDILARVPRRPTNEEIAAILKLPKGTVDSTLYYLRRRYGIALEPGQGFRHTRRHEGSVAGHQQRAQEARVPPDLRGVLDTSPG